MGITRWTFFLQHAQTWFRRDTSYLKFVIARFLGFELIFLILFLFGARSWAKILVWFSSSGSNLFEVELLEVAGYFRRALAGYVGDAPNSLWSRKRKGPRLFIGIHQISGSRGVALSLCFPKDRWSKLQTVLGASHESQCCIWRCDRSLVGISNLWPYGRPGRPSIEKHPRNLDARMIPEGSSYGLQSRVLEPPKHPMLVGIAAKLYPFGHLWAPSIIC